MSHGMRVSALPMMSLQYPTCGMEKLTISPSQMERTFIAIKPDGIQRGLVLNLSLQFSHSIHSLFVPSPENLPFSNTRPGAKAFRADIGASAVGDCNGRPGVVNSVANSNSPSSSRFGRRGGNANLSLTSSWSVGAVVHRQLRICAATGQSGEDERSSTMRRVATSERSEACNEELLLFLFQLDLVTRLQRALNSEQYEAAQQLREKIAEVEQEVTQQREEKMGSVSSKDEAQDSALTVLRLKAELQTAIDGEDYVGAAQIRDRISKLESAALAASARALVYQNLKYTYRLGQRLKHRIYGYLGIICGMDPTCCETGDWVKGANVDQLPRGRNQPFYQVLVDVHEQPSLLVGYVAEDNLVPMEDGAKIERFDHPYTYFLFYGMDSKGDFIPSKQLREKYNAARHELPWDGNDDSPEDLGSP